MLVLDEALYDWFSDKRSEGKPVSGTTIIEKALNHKRKINIEANKVFRWVAQEP